MTEPMTSERCPCCGGPCTKGREEYPDVDGGEPDFVDTYRYTGAQPAQAVDVGDESLERALRELLAGRGLYVMRPEHIKDTTRPLNTIKYGMVMNGKVLFTCKEPSALTGEKAGPVDSEVLIAIERGEGYEDVHPELVAEDCMGNAAQRGWSWRVVSTSPAPDKEGL